MITTATLDRLLAVLVGGVVVTGFSTLSAGAPSSAWLYVLHGMIAGALAAAIVLKLRAAVPRAVERNRWRRLAFASIVTFAAIGAIIGGYAWAMSGTLLTVGSWTALTLHAWFGLVLAPLVALHLLPRRWRLLRPGRRSTDRVAAAVSRRSLLVASGFVASGAAAYAIAAAADTALGGTRRFTGSRWLPRDTVPPTTTFLGDTSPAADPATWRVAVTGRVTRSMTFDVAALRELGVLELRATLDCTSGWAVDTTWRGTPLAAVLDAVGAPPDRPVIVRSATGWLSQLSATDARRAVLATHVAGRELPMANGAPLRLVAPDHRGLDWVKWVTEVRVG